MLVLSSALMFTGCNVEKMSTLRDISRPYAGEYKCSRLQLGGEDLLPQMKYLKLKLGYYGDFCVTYADFAGGAGEYSGTYRMEDGAVVPMRAARKRSMSFRLKTARCISPFSSAASRSKRNSARLKGCFFRPAVQADRAF